MTLPKLTKLRIGCSKLKSYWCPVRQRDRDKKGGQKEEKENHFGCLLESQRILVRVQVRDPEIPPSLESFPPISRDLDRKKIKKTSVSKDLKPCTTFWRHRSENRFSWLLEVSFFNTFINVQIVWHSYRVTEGPHKW